MSVGVTRSAILQMRLSVEYHCTLVTLDLVDSNASVTAKEYSVPLERNFVNADSRIFFLQNYSVSPLVCSITNIQNTTEGRVTH